MEQSRKSVEQERDFKKYGGPGALWSGLNWPLTISSKLTIID